MLGNLEAVRLCISAGAIVVHDSRVLMVRHRKPGTCDFQVCPGGGVQGTESLEAAARREVKEETGLDVKFGQLATSRSSSAPR